MDLSLKASGRDQFITMLDLLPAPAMLALNPQCTEVHYNPAFLKAAALPVEYRRFHGSDLSAGRPYHWYLNGIPITLDQHPLYIAATNGAAVAEREFEMRLKDGRSKWFLMSASPIIDETGRIEGAMASLAERTATRELEHLNENARQRLAYLAEAGEALSESLNTNAVLDTLVRVLVPRYADCVSITLIDPERGWRPVKVYHRDPHFLQRLEKFEQSVTAPKRYLVAERVVERGAGEIIDDLAQLLGAEGTDPVYRDYVKTLHEEFDMARAIIAPMKNRGIVTGLVVATGSRDRNYTIDDMRVLEELGRRAASAIENAQSYEKERQVSQTLQEALLPMRLPRTDAVQYDTVYVAGDDEALIGGDWFDAFDVQDGGVAISIGDVTGRGVQAAVIMGKVRQTLKALSLYERDPARLLDASDIVLRQVYDEAIVTAIVGFLDPKTGQFHYAGAGHPPPMLRLADGSVLELPSDGLPLGLRMTYEPSSVTVWLQEGDMILLFTDGLMESTHDLREGERRIRTALAALAHDQLREAAHFVRDAVLYDGSRDDVAILSMRLCTNVDYGEAMRWSFDAANARLAHESRGFFMQYLLAKGAPGEDYGSAELVFGELIGNAVRHTSGMVNVEIDWNHELPVLSVSDEGKGFSLEAHLPQDPLDEAGRGLYLVTALAPKFHVEQLPGGGSKAVAVLNLKR